MIEKKINLESLCDQICDLPLLDVSELVDLLKVKLNIKDLPMLAAVAPVASNVESEKVVMKEEVSLVLKSYESTKKAKIIKALRDIKKSEGIDIGIKEAKDLVESSPVTVCENIPVAKAEQYLQSLKDVGAEVEIK